MRKASLLCAFMFLSVSATPEEGRIKIANIGPSTVANSAATNNQVASRDVALAAGAAGVKNCLTSLDITAAGTGILRVLDGGTTVYAVTIQSNGSLVRDFEKDDAMCGSNATQMFIAFTTSTAGAYNLNYKGYTY